MVTNCSDVWVKNENIDVQCTLYIGIGRWHQCLHHTDAGRTNIYMEYNDNHDDQTSNDFEDLNFVSPAI